MEEVTCLFNATLMSRHKSFRYSTSGKAWCQCGRGAALGLLSVGVEHAGASALKLSTANLRGRISRMYADRALFGDIAAQTDESHDAVW